MKPVLPLGRHLHTISWQKSRNTTLLIVQMKNAVSKTSHPVMILSQKWHTGIRFKRHCTWYGKISSSDCVKTDFVWVHRLLRGGLQLSDISENPNNDRIDGDPSTQPPYSNKCLMQDVFMVLHIPGVNWLLPTISTVQGVISRFIPTENGDERLGCMHMCCCNYLCPKT